MTTKWWETNMDVGQGVKAVAKKVEPRTWPKKKCRCGALVIRAHDVRYQDKVIDLEPNPGAVSVTNAVILVGVKKPVAYMARETDPESCRYRIHRCSAFQEKKK